MSLPTAYLSTFKKTAEIFQAIQSAQAPPRFTQKFLEGLGFPNSNDRTHINVLKALGFLDDSGVPTKRYHEYLDQSQSALILAQGIREAYADLFSVNINAQNLSSAEVRGKMKTLSAGQFSERVLTQMVGTFTTLVKIADFSGTPVANAGSGARQARDTSHADDQEDGVDPSDDEGTPKQTRRRAPRIGDLVYNINIVLPESRDAAVYDALFKALREHLGE